jgi:RNA ligase
MAATGAPHFRKALPMSTIFPVIEHIDPVLAAIAGRDEFTIHRNDALGFISVTYRYIMADTFPDLDDDAIDPAERLRRQLVRECRGITFSAATGRVIARKFHKFFNVGERAETLAQRIDWTRPHVRLVKADGSLMTPIDCRGQVRWASKMGVTKVSGPVEAFVADHAGYAALARDAIALGVTPQFEWCSSAAQRIILDYPDANLVLLAIRENTSGRYWSQAEIEALAAAHGVPCITQAGDPIVDHAAYLAALAQSTGIEGEVIAFETGERYKVKTTEYLRIHRALAGLVQEKDVLTLVLEERVDDVKPFLTGDLGARLDAYAAVVNRGLDRTAETVAARFHDGYAQCGGDRKRFAVEFVPAHKADASFLFALWSHAQAGDEALRAAARDLLRQQVQKNLGSSTRVEQARRLFGDDVQWTVEIPDLDA